MKSTEPQEHPGKALGLSHAYASYPKDDYVAYFIRRPITNKQTATAYIIDPATIYTVITAIASYLKSKRNSEWQKDVGDRLTDISNKLDTILTELADLKIWINDALDEEVRKMWGATINANRKRLAGVISSLIPNDHNQPETKPDEITIQHILWPMLTDQLLTTLKMSEWSRYGFSHYQEVITGYATTIPMAVLVGDTVDIVTVKLSTTDFLEQAINPLNQKSFGYAMNAAASQMASYNQVAESILNKWWITGHRSIQDGEDNQGNPTFNHQWDTGHYYGSPAAGITNAEYKQYNSRSDGDAPDYDTYPRGGLLAADIQSNIESFRYWFHRHDQLLSCYTDCMTALGVLKQL